jgi:hypothetical protein
MNRSNPQKPLKDELLSVRMPNALKERLHKVGRRTRLSISTLTQESLEAICRYFEQHDEIRLPFRLVSSKEPESLRTQTGRGPRRD